LEEKAWAREMFPGSRSAATVSFTSTFTILIRLD
jgi:hypothetical protein